MTLDATPPHTLPFRDHESYVQWELERVQLRARAFIAARAGEQDVDAFLALSQRLHAERPQISAERRALARSGESMTFELLAQRFGLGPVDEDVLFILMAMHLSANTRELLLHAQGRPQRQSLELGFVTELLRPGRALSSLRGWADADSPLVRSGLVCVRHPLGDNLGTRLGHAVETPHYLAAAVGRGQLVVDERLSHAASLQPAQATLDDVILPLDSQESVERFLRAFRGSTRRTPWRVLVHGPAQVGKTLLTHALTDQSDGLVFTLRCDQLEPRAALQHLELAAHNAAFLDATLLLVRPEALLSRPSGRAHLGAVLHRHPGLVVVETRDGATLERELDGHLDAQLELTTPDAKARLDLWESACAHSDLDETDVDLHAIAKRHALSGGQIVAALRWAERCANGGPLTQEALEDGAAAQSRTRLGHFTDRAAGVELEQLVLPPAHMEQVRSLMSACRNREQLLERWGFDALMPTGRGLVALFHGAPGTGKTLCARILAQHLGRELRVVSIPQVVSKWVGETEKNVRELFREARSGQEVLLFDEADALFTRRVQVENAQDHLQNMEVGVLLQELERYDGVVVLTTNRPLDMDEAFARRILFKIPFPLPAPAQRARIWRTLIPAAAPREADINFTALGEFFPFSGGQIRNAVLRAAYMSLERNKPLSFATLSEAGRLEMSTTPATS